MHYESIKNRLNGNIKPKFHEKWKKRVQILKIEEKKNCQMFTNANLNECHHKHIEMEVNRYQSTLIY